MQVQHYVFERLLFEEALIMAISQEIMVQHGAQKFCNGIARLVQLLAATVTVGVNH